MLPDVAVLNSAMPGLATSSRTQPALMEAKAEDSLPSLGGVESIREINPQE